MDKKAAKRAEAIVSVAACVGRAGPRLKALWVGRGIAQALVMVHGPMSIVHSGAQHFRPRLDQNGEYKEPDEVIATGPSQEAAQSLHSAAY